MPSTARIAESSQKKSSFSLQGSSGACCSFSFPVHPGGWWDGEEEEKKNTRVVASISGASRCAQALYVHYYISSCRPLSGRIIPPTAEKREVETRKLNDRGEAAHQAG